jgi:hypothetical protein
MQALTNKAMIDTIILTIPKEKVITLSNGRDVPAWDLHSRTFNYEKYVKNPPKPVSPFTYMPRLTMVKRRITKGEFNSFLKIEFSAPKLLYVDNVNELNEEDFPLVIKTLYKRLCEMGVIITETDLVNGSVSAFHASKNFIITEGYTAAFIVRELIKINLNMKFDLSKTTFRNHGKSLEGKSMQGHTLRHSIVFYDKIADLARSKRKAIDKDQTHQQLSLFEAIKAKHPALQILRMEVRLAQKQKMNAVLRKLGYIANPFFKDIFKKEVCQKIIQHYWETMIEKENLFLFGLGRSPKKLHFEILQGNPKMRVKETIYLVGLDALCRDEGGIRELRNMLENRIKQRNWYRIADDLKILNRLTTATHIHGWVGQIIKQIREFTPFKINKS